MYFVSPASMRADRGVLDVARGIEIRLALRQADHVFPVRDHFPRDRRDGDGQAGLDAVEAFGGERHGGFPGLKAPDTSETGHVGATARPRGWIEAGRNGDAQDRVNGSFIPWPQKRKAGGNGPAG